MENLSSYAMLLAAGLGTRLGPLSGQRPKPMLPVCNSPLVAWSMALCGRHGIKDFIINLHHLGDQIQQHLEPWARGRGGTLGFSVEEQILGTGGGIRRMARLQADHGLRGTCLAMNAKIVTDVDLAQAVRAHHASGALATLVVRPHPEAERWGAVAVEPDGRVGRILRHRRPGDRPAEAHMFTGIHVLSPELVERIPPGESCIVRDTYIPLLEQGLPLHAHLHRGYFYDHSTPARYLQGNLNLLAGAVAPEAAPGPLSGVHPEARVAPSARITGPVLLGPGAAVEDEAQVGPGVVLGPGAVVEAGVSLRDAVVWDRARVVSSAARVIATGATVLEVPDQGDPEARPR